MTVTAISPVAAQELLLKNARERMDILAAYREVVSYRGAANGVAFRYCCDNVTVLWLMMVLKGCRLTGGCRTGSRLGC